MKTTWMFILSMTVLPAVATAAQSGKSLLDFDSMFPVEKPFVNSTAVRGVKGGHLPWDIESTEGHLTTDGDLAIHVRGLVLGKDSDVPPGLRGINPFPEFRGLVSCLSEDSYHRVTTVNLTTQGFPATRGGDSDIVAQVKLPSPCVAPIIFVLSGSQNEWFSVTGQGTEASGSNRAR